MPTTLTQVRKLTRLTRRDPGLLILAGSTFALLIVMRVVITLLSLSSIARHLGTAMEESSIEGGSDEDMRYARRVAWSIRRVAPLTPTTSNCYPQALTARYLLHQRGIASTIYYGAAFAADEPGLETHVWLRCGPTVVTGAPAHLRYGVVSKFADAPLGSWLARMKRSFPLR